jgi:hypothetical protein
VLDFICQQELKGIAANAMGFAKEQAAGMNPPPPKPANVQLIITILPQSAAEIRRAVKHFGDVEYGIQTQCIVSGIMYLPECH